MGMRTALAESTFKKLNTFTRMSVDSSKMKMRFEQWEPCLYSTIYVMNIMGSMFVLCFYGLSYDHNGSYGAGS